MALDVMYFQVKSHGFLLNLLFQRMRVFSTHLTQRAATGIRAGLDFALTVPGVAVRGPLSPRARGMARLVALAFSPLTEGSPPIEGQKRTTSGVHNFLKSCSDARLPLVCNGRLRASQMAPRPLGLPPLLFCSPSCSSNSSLAVSAGHARGVTLSS